MAGRELKEGVLGVVVIGVALVCALFGSYFAGITANTEDTIVYDYLADVSGLFDYDKSPQYIEYDPSSNYTGYYSTATGDYWPSDYMGYTPSVDSQTGTTKVNNYKVNLPPNDYIINTASLNSLPNENIPGTNYTLNRVMYYNEPITSLSNPYFGNNYHIADRIDSTTLATVVSTLTIGTADPKTLDQYDIIRMKAQSSIDDVEWGSGVEMASTGWVVFYVPEWITHTVSSSGGVVADYRILPMVNPTYFNTWDWKSTVLKTKCVPCLSCEVNLESRTVALYQDNDYSVLVGTYSITDVSVAHYHNEAVTDISSTMTLSDNITVRGELFPSPEYIDPKQGVYMKGVEE